MFEFPQQQILKLARWLLTLVCAAAWPVVACAEDAPAWGTLEGQFVYDGDAPEPIELDTSKDRQQCDAFMVVDETITVGSTGGLANVVIYVRSQVENVHPDFQPFAEVVLQLKGCRFEPHITGLWAGKQKLRITNGDAGTHNPDVETPISKGPPFLLSPPGDTVHEFERGFYAPLPVTCNIHPWEKAYVLTRPNPYFAVTGPDGKFTISNLPTGEIELQVWHESVGFLAADPAWQKGRVKLTIEEGLNQLGPEGVVKVSPTALKKQEER